MCSTAEAAKSATPASIASTASVITTRGDNGETSIRFLIRDSQGNVIEEVGSTIEGGTNTFNLVIVNDPCITSVDRREIEVLSARELRSEAFPALTTLVDRADRTLDRLNGYTGRGKLTVIKDNVNSPIMVSRDFFINGMSFSESEAFSVQKNNIGYVLYAFDTNPIGISISGILLDGSDRESEQGLAHSRNIRSNQIRGRIENTEWFTGFIKDYNNFFKASVAIKNNYRVFFGIENFSAEVFCVGFNAEKQAQPQPLLVPFKMEMIVKRLPTSGSNTTDQNTKPKTTKGTTGKSGGKSDPVSTCEDLSGNYDTVINHKNLHGKPPVPPFVDWSKACSPSRIISSTNK